MNIQVNKHEKIKKPTFEVVDDFKLKSIFNEYKKMRENNQGKVNYFLQGLPLEIKNQLLSQENNLEMLNHHENRNNRFSKFLTKRTKKKEEDLLFTKIDSHRIKRELSDVIDMSKDVEDSYGIYRWNVSLRKPKDFQGSRNAFINLRSGENPLWLGFKETIPKSIEFVRKPHSNSMLDIENLTSNKYMPELNENVNLNRSINRMKNLNNLEVKIKIFYKKYYNNFFKYLFRLKVRIF